MYDTRNLSQFSRFGELAPDAFKSFVAFDEAAFKGGALPVKYKELMGIAVALTTQCPYCIEIHTKKAKLAGATEQELAETTLVAAALRAGKRGHARNPHARMTDQNGRVVSRRMPVSRFEIRRRHPIARAYRA